MAAWSEERVRTVVVDGQEFLVKPRSAEPGVYDVDWTTGPNPGYGFSSATSDGIALSPAEVEEGIRGFLRGINPETGYLD